MIPGVLRRYAEWIAVSQGLDPDAAAETINFSRVPTVFTSLLRLRSMIPGDPAGPSGMQPGRRGQTRRATCRAADARAARPRHSASEGRTRRDLQSQIRSYPGSHLGDCSLACADRRSRCQGWSGWLRKTTDSLTIEADLTAPAVLLVTDAYSDGWNVRSLLPCSRDRCPEALSGAYPPTIAYAEFRWIGGIMKFCSNTGRSPTWSANGYRWLRGFSTFWR